MESIRAPIFKFAGVDGNIWEMKSIEEIIILFIHPCGSANAASKKASTTAAATKKEIIGVKKAAKAANNAGIFLDAHK
jgi:hypothetical protein